MLEQSLSERKIHRITIAGQVKNAITKQGISGATVKLIEAPKQFMTQVIIKAKLLELHSLQMQAYSSGMARHPPHKSNHQKVKDFQQFLENYDFQALNQLEFIEEIISDATLTPLQKFQALQAALDRISSIPNQKIAQLERTITTSDGWFYFVNLPDGLYNLEASLPLAGSRYGTAQAEIEIANEQPKNQVKLNPKIALSEQLSMEFLLEPTMLFGKILGADEDNEAISLAKVQIQGSEYYTFSCGELVKQQQQEWNYRLIGIEAGNTPQTVIVTAKGYLTAQKEVSLQPGKSNLLNFELSPQ